ncbi:hypothetical protein MY11210_005865 [Beauveria gryllotalpidicola]
MPPSRRLLLRLLLLLCGRGHVAVLAPVMAAVMAAGGRDDDGRRRAWHSRQLPPRARRRPRPTRWPARFLAACSPDEFSDAFVRSGKRQRLRKPGSCLGVACLLVKPHCY